MGLLVMAYGTPYKEEDIERYYTHIRHGRKPSEEALQDLTERYRAIGGISPLAEITKAQANGLMDKLNEIQDELEFSVYIGLKHIEPFIEDAVQQMKDDGIEEAVSIVLAPHYSKFSVNTYNERAAQEAEKLGGLKISSVKHWHNVEGFINLWSEHLTKTLDSMPKEERDHSMLIVSAHSLPERFVAGGDPYVEQLEETARLIAEKADVKDYRIGWQSEGNTPDPWLGPDVQDLTRDLYKEGKYKAFIYAPVGFVADHLEVLYDNDYECKVVCDEVGAKYYRPKMPNTEPQFIEMLAGVCLNQLKRDTNE